MIFEDFDMDGTVTVTATPSTPSPAMLRARRAEADPDFPCLIWAAFRWKGTDTDYTTSFDNYGQLRDFEKRNPRLELQDWVASKARYLYPPKVTDLSDGHFHWRYQIEGAAKILGYNTARETASTMRRRGDEYIIRH